MKINRVIQISESHCGPAVLQMLLEAIDVRITQEGVVNALGIEDRLEEHGVRPDQLGMACSILAPDTIFWYKYGANLDDVAYILDRGFAVGVEWQGLFYKSEEEEAEHGGDNSDYGHYSIISYYNQDEGMLILVDPYKDFVHQDRIFDADTFLNRWWDTNEVVDTYTGQKQIVEDNQFLFFVTPKDTRFPHDFGFKVYRGTR